MWNIKNIRYKKEIIAKKLKECNNINEKILLLLTLTNYINILNSNKSIKIRLYNTIDNIINGNYTLIKETYNKTNKIFIEEDYLDINYLDYLLKLVNIISSSNLLSQLNDEDKNRFNFKKLNLSTKDLINISKLFFKYLNDEELYIYAMEVLNNEDYLNYTKEFSNKYINAYGLTFFDYYYKKVYSTIARTNTILDLQANNHEITHGIDFYYGKKMPTINYYGFHEIPTYTMDYLFINYLDKLELDKEETQKLRLKKDLYLYKLALQINNEIKELNLLKNDKNNTQKYTTKDVYNILDWRLKRKLLELESGIIAYGLYKQICTNYEYGMNNLKLFMKSTIPKNQKPNFEFINLNDNTILDLAHEIGYYSNKDKNILLKKR